MKDGGKYGKKEMSYDGERSIAKSVFWELLHRGLFAAVIGIKPCAGEISRSKIWHKEGLRERLKQEWECIPVGMLFCFPSQILCKTTDKLYNKKMSKYGAVKSLTWEAECNSLTATSTVIDTNRDPSDWKTTAKAGRYRGGWFLSQETCHIGTHFSGMGKLSA